MLMKEYRIRITGKYDVIVLSPKMITTLIDKIRHSNSKEMVVPAEDILPQGYAEYLTRVLDANTEVAKTLPNRNAYTLIADQIRKMQCNEMDCFNSVDVTEPANDPQLDMEASRDFFIVTKQKNSQFRYIVKSETGEEINIVLEYM